MKKPNDISCFFTFFTTFADDTLLFSVAHNAYTTAKELNNDLVKISRWAYQWKMSFNPDPSK